MKPTSDPTVTSSGVQRHAKSVTIGR
jgi:hypothetical protein